jgi:hypothetical protein
MATITPTIIELEPFDGSVFRVTWANLANGDDGVPITRTSHADRTIQFKNTFGAGGTVVFEGSNDTGTTYKTLTDQSDNAISKTAADLESVMQVPEMSRPRVTAGDGTTSITAIAVIRRSNPLRQ